MLFFVRFLLAFVLTLAVAVALIYIFKPSFAMMSSPTAEKAVLVSIYKQQDNAAVNRTASESFANVASYCLFFDSHNNPMPVPAMQQKLTTLYAGMRHVKATSNLESVKFDGNVASVLAQTKVDWTTKGGRSMEVRILTRDKWEKLVGHWTCEEVRTEDTNNSHIGFVVPH